MEAKIDAEIFYTFIKGAEAISKEIEISFKSNEMETNMMSQDKSIMLIAKLKNSEFISYKPSNKTMNISLNGKNLLKLIPKKNAIISLKIIDGNLELSTYDNTFLIPILENNTEEQPEPKITPTAIWKIPQAEFKDILKQAELADEYLQMETNQTEVIFSAKGEGTFNKTITRDKFHKYSINGGIPTISLYDIAKLKALTKPTKKPDEIEIAYSKDKPLRMDYISSSITFKYYLAPYILEEETNDNKSVNK